MSSFSEEVFLWAILELCLNENVWNYYVHQKKCVRLTVNQNTLTYLKYLILETPDIFFDVLIFSVDILVLHTLTLYPGSILESKRMGGIFQKKRAKKAQNIWKIAKLNKIWKHFERGLLTECYYFTQ